MTRNRVPRSPDAVEITFDQDLIAVLDSLGIHWATAKPNNGVLGTVKVTLDVEADYRLEQLIHLLSDIRWHYTPGRAMQLGLRLDDDTH